MRPVFSPKEYDLIRDLSNVYGTAKQFVLVTPLTKNVSLPSFGDRTGLPIWFISGVDPWFFSGRVQHQVHRIPMNRTCDNVACKMSALTNRRANSPDFSAKLPFLVIQPCLVYFNTKKTHFFSFAECMDCMELYGLWKKPTNKFLASTLFSFIDVRWYPPSVLLLSPVASSSSSFRKAFLHF